MNTILNWLWGVWACVAGGVIAGALRQEVAAIRRQQGGANGLMWVAAMLIGGFGSLVLAGITWWFAGGREAFRFAVWATVALALTGGLCVWRLKSAIRRAIPGSQPSVR